MQGRPKGSKNKRTLLDIKLHEARTGNDWRYTQQKRLHWSWQRIQRTLNTIVQTLRENPENWPRMDEAVRLLEQLGNVVLGVNTARVSPVEVLATLAHAVGSGSGLDILLAARWHLETPHMPTCCLSVQSWWVATHGEEPPCV